MEKLAPTGIRSPDRPARSRSPYLLRYPGPKYIYIICKIQGYQRNVVENLVLLILCHVRPCVVINISKDHNDFKMVVTVYQAT